MVPIGRKIVNYFTTILIEYVKLHCFKIINFNVNNINIIIITGTDERG